MLLPDRVWNDETLIDMGAVHMDENDRIAQDENMDYRVLTLQYGECQTEWINIFLHSQDIGQREMLYYICMGLLQKQKDETIKSHLSVERHGNHTLL